MRGEAENTTITKEMIDNFFDNVDGILTLNFTGGEPLLALDEIEYAIDRIISQCWWIGSNYQWYDFR